MRNWISLPSLSARSSKVDLLGGVMVLRHYGGVAEKPFEDEPLYIEAVAGLSRSIQSRLS